MKVIIGIRIILVAILTTYLKSRVTSFPSGPPRGSCVNALPFHVRNGTPIAPQDYSSPYIISVNVTSYQPGDAISIRVHSYVRALFKGLFLQVRPLPDSDGKSYIDEPLGTYFRTIENTQVINCRLFLDTITHLDGFSKVEAKLDWRAPLFAKNDIEVRATVLKDFATYWTNVKSRRISLERKEVVQFPVEKLEKPWVKEIIRTIKAEDNPTLRKQLVKERFAKGLKNAIDPNGYVMVNFVNDMLPFEDKFPTSPAENKTPDGGDVTPFPQQNGSNDTVTTSTAAPDLENDETAIPLPGQFGIEVPVGVRFVEGNASLSEYERCLRDVLRGDYSNIDRLSELVEQKP